MGVSYVRKGDGGYYLEADMERFKVPSKLYGDMGKQVNYFWNAYARSATSMGILLTGASGAGKSEISKLLCNRAIDNNIQVIMVTDLKADLELIHFLNKITFAVLFFDEFGKNFNIELQDQMLTMLSDMKGSKKLILMTENKIYRISEFIRNRPGRVRYHLDFERLPKNVFVEYCADQNLSEGFYKDLLAKYNTAPVFSFDHLDAIITEYHAVSGSTLDSLLDMLNLEILSKPLMYQIDRVFDNDSETVVNFETLELEKKDFDNGRRWYIQLKPDVYKGDNPPPLFNRDHSLKISMEDVTNVTEEKVTLLVKSRYKITLRIT